MQRYLNVSPRSRAVPQIRIHSPNEESNSLVLDLQQKLLSLESKYSNFVSKCTALLQSNEIPKEPHDLFSECGSSLNLTPNIHSHSRISSIEHSEKLLEALQEMEEGSLLKRLIRKVTDVVQLNEEKIFKVLISSEKAKLKIKETLNRMLGEIWEVMFDNESSIQGIFKYCIDRINELEKSTKENHRLKEKYDKLRSERLQMEEKVNEQNEYLKKIKNDYVELRKNIMIGNETDRKHPSSCIDFYLEGERSSSVSPRLEILRQRGKEGQEKNKKARYFSNQATDRKRSTPFIEYKSSIYEQEKKDLQNQLKSLQDKLVGFEKIAKSIITNSTRSETSSRDQAQSDTKRSKKNLIIESPNVSALNPQIPILNIDHMEKNLENVERKKFSLISSLKSDKKAFRNKFKDFNQYNHKIQTLEATIKEFVIENEKLKSDLDNEKALSNDLKAEKIKIEEALSSIERLNEQLIENKNVLNEKVNEKNDQIEEIHAELSSFKVKHSALLEKNKAYKQGLKENRDEKIKLINLTAKHAKSIAALEAIISGLKLNETRLKSEIENFREITQKLEEDNAMIGITAEKMHIQVIERLQNEIIELQKMLSDKDRKLDDSEKLREEKIILQQELLDKENESKEIENLRKELNNLKQKALFKEKVLGENERLKKQMKDMHQEIFDKEKNLKDSEKLLINISELQQIILEKNKIIEKAQFERQQEIDSRMNIISSLQQSISTLSSENAELKLLHSHEIKSLQSELLSATTSISTLTSDLNFKISEIKELLEKNASLTSENSELSKNSMLLNSCIEELSEKINFLELTISETEKFKQTNAFSRESDRKSIKELKRKNKEITERNAMLENHIKSITEEWKGFKDHVGILKDELAKVRSSNEAAEIEFKENQERSEAMRNTIKELNEAKINLEKMICDKDFLISSLEISVKESAESEKIFEEAVTAKANLNSLLKTKENELKLLESALESYKSNESANILYIEELKNELNSLQLKSESAQSSFTSKISSIEENLSAQSKELKEKTLDLSKLYQEKEALTLQISELTLSLKSQTETSQLKTESLVSTMNSLKQNLIDLTRANEELSESLKANHDKIKILREENNKLEGKNKKYIEENAIYLSELEAQTNENKEMLSEFSEIQGKYNKALAEEKKYKKDIESMKRKIENLEDKVKEYESNEAELLEKELEQERELEKCQSECNNLKSKLKINERIFLRLKNVIQLSKITEIKGSLKVFRNIIVTKFQEFSQSLSKPEIFNSFTIAYKAQCHNFESRFKDLSEKNTLLLNALNDYRVKYDNLFNDSCEKIKLYEGLLIENTTLKGTVLTLETSISSLRDIEQKDHFIMGKLGEYEESLEKLRQSNSELLKEIEKAKFANFELEKSDHTKKETINDLTRQVSRLNLEQMNDSKKYIEKNKMIENLTEKLEDLEAQLIDFSEIKKENANKKFEFLQIDKENQGLIKKLSECEAILDTKSKKLDEAMELNNKLKQDCSNLSKDIQKRINDNTKLNENKLKLLEEKETLQNKLAQQDLVIKLHEKQLKLKEVNEDELNSLINKLKTEIDLLKTQNPDTEALKNSGLTENAIPIPQKNKTNSSNNKEESSSRRSSHLDAINITPYKIIRSATAANKKWVLIQNENGSMQWKDEVEIQYSFTGTNLENEENLDDIKVALGEHYTGSAIEAIEKLKELASRDLLSLSIKQDEFNVKKREEFDTYSFQGEIFEGEMDISEIHSPHNEAEVTDRLNLLLKQKTEKLDKKKRTIQLLKEQLQSLKNQMRSMQEDINKLQVALKEAENKCQASMAINLPYLKQIYSNLILHLKVEKSTDEFIKIIYKILDFSSEEAQRLESQRKGSKQPKTLPKIL